MGANVEESVGGRNEKRHIFLQNKCPICLTLWDGVSICNCQTNCQRMLHYIYDTSNEMGNRINAVTKDQRNCELFNILLMI